MMAGACRLRVGVRHIGRAEARSRCVRWSLARSVSVSTPPSPSPSMPDAIYVLCGGQTRDGGVPPWVEARAIAASSQWKKLKEASARPPAVVLLGAGSPHAPPVMNEWGHVKHESTSTAEVCLREGVPAEYLYKERSSYDTIGNAFFSLVDFSAPRAWRSVFIYSSEFHIERTRKTFNWVYGARGCTENGGPDAAYELTFIGVDNVGLGPDTLRARREKERQSLESLSEKINSYTSLPEIHEFVHQKHGCYSVRQQHLFGVRDPGVSDAALDSY